MRHTSGCPCSTSSPSSDSSPSSFSDMAALIEDSAGLPYDIMTAMQRPNSWCSRALQKTPAEGIMSSAVIVKSKKVLLA